MSERFDLVVVGGGPSGAVLATYAGRAGMRVLLVDKDTFPRDKVCGDALTPSALQELERLGCRKDLERLPHRAIRGLTLHDDERTIRHESNGRILACVVRRLDFDHLLLDQARQVADVREGLQVTGLIGSDDTVEGIIARNEEGRSLRVRAPVVAGADGFGSLVRRRSPLPSLPVTQSSIATRGYYQNVPVEADTIEFYFLDELAPGPGYLWIFPLDRTTVNVGIILYRSTLKAAEHTLLELHDNLLARAGLKDRFERSTRVGKIRAWNLPMATKRVEMCCSGALLCGDAAALVDPLWGDGIDTAMVSGRLAAEHLIGLGWNDLAPIPADQFRPYADRVWKTIGTRLKYSAKFSKGLLMKKFLYPGRSTVDLFEDIYFRDVGQSAHG